MDFSFSKEEKLCSRKAFDCLIKTGRTTFLFPFRAQWMVTDYPLTVPVQVAFAVPKKRFKRANKRNFIKRRLREAYRLHKEPLYQLLDGKQIRIQLLLVYIAPEALTFHEIEPKLVALLGKIMAELQEPS